jgi:PBP1b-binding outer membrane lipoprotein LpoB
MGSKMTTKLSLSLALCAVTGALLLTGCSHNDATTAAVSAPPPAAAAPAGNVQQQIQAIQSSDMPPTLKAQQIQNLREQNHEAPNGAPIPAAPAGKP